MLDERVETDELLFEFEGVDTRVLVSELTVPLLRVDSPCDERTVVTFPRVSTLPLFLEYTDERPFKSEPMELLLVI